MSDGTTKDQYHLYDPNYGADEDEFDVGAYKTFSAELKRIKSEIQQDPREFVRVDKGPHTTWSVSEESAPESTK